MERKWEEGRGEEEKNKWDVCVMKCMRGGGNDGDGDDGSNGSDGGDSGDDDTNH